MTLDDIEPGREVACAPLGIFFRALSRQGLFPETLSQGTGHAPDRLLDPSERVGWDAYCVFLQNAARVWSPDEIVQLGRDLCRSHWDGPRGRLAGWLYRPEELYARLGRPRQEALPRPASQRLSVEADRSGIRIEIEMVLGYEPSPEHDLLWEGMLQAVPREVGLSPARVEAIRLPRRVRYEIEPPSSPAWLAGLRRAATRPFATRAALADLREANARLERRARQLESQVAEQRQVEETLLSQQSRLRVVTEQLPAVLWTTDRSLRFTSSTGAALVSLGLQTDQVVGMTIQDYFQSQDPHFLPVASHLQALDGQAANYEFEWQGAIFQVHVEPLHDEAGDVAGTIGIALEITERVELEEQVRAAQKMEAMGTLAGGIAHDFNNILASILGNAQLCMADVDEGTVVHGNLREIFKAGTRARDLVGQILQFSRGSARRREMVGLADVVDDALRFLRASLPASVQIQRRLGQDRVCVEADTAQIYQVVVNLCSNAAAAMHEKGGTLTVAVEEVDVSSELAERVVDLHAGRYGSITVSDEGCGIPASVMDRIFDPFFSTDRSGEATGMGLAVVYGIVKSHRGAIDVESEEGTGTTVSIYLPLQDEPAGEELQESAELPSGSGRILLVDDEQAIVRVGRHMLEFLGYEVVTCISGAEAFARFERDPQSFDLLLTDQSMPDMPGDVLARKILALRPDLPVVLCTGYSERITEAQAKAMGMHEYLTKPILLEKLAEVVHDALEGARV